MKIFGKKEISLNHKGEKVMNQHEITTIREELKSVEKRLIGTLYTLTITPYQVNLLQSAIIQEMNKVINFIYSLAEEG